MRITYIHQHFKTPDQPGGARPYEFARRLAEAGHEVTMICGGTDRRRYEVAGFRVEQLPVAYDNTMPMWRRLISFAMFMARSSVVAVRVPADTVFASSTPLTVVVPGILASLKHGANFVLEIRDLWPQVPIALGHLPRGLHGMARALERIGYAAADHVVALSPDMTDGVREIDPRVPVTVIPNSADFPERSRTRHGGSETRTAGTAAAVAQFGVREDEKLLVYAGSLGEIYDPTWLTALALCLHESGWHLLVVGEGTGREPARQKLKRAGLDPDRTFVGGHPRTDVMNLLVGADVVVSSVIDQPELEAASINKVFDAMAVGRPVACNHAGWLRDLLAEHGAVIELPREPTPENVLPILDAWTREDLEAAGERARSLGRAAFARDDHAARLRELLEGVNSSTRLARIRRTTAALMLGQRALRRHHGASDLKRKPDRGNWRSLGKANLGASSEWPA